MSNMDFRGSNNRWCVAPHQTGLKIYERAFLLLEEFYAEYGDTFLFKEDAPSKLGPFNSSLLTGGETQIVQKIQSDNLSSEDLAWIFCFCSSALKYYEYTDNHKQTLFSLYSQRYSLKDVKQIIEAKLEKDADALNSLAVKFQKEMDKYGNLITPYQIEEYTGVPRARYNEILSMSAVPAKGTIYSLAFFFQLDIETTKEWLKAAGYTTFESIPDILFEKCLENEEKGFASFCMACNNLQKTIRTEHPEKPKKLTELDRVITSKVVYDDRNIVHFLEKHNRDPRDYNLKPNKHQHIRSLDLEK